MDRRHLYYSPSFHILGAPQGLGGSTCQTRSPNGETLLPTQVDP